VVETRETESFDDLRSNRLRVFAGDVYVLPVIPVAAPLSDGEIRFATEAIRDAAQIGLVLLRPSRELSGADLAQSVARSALPPDQLPEGFSGASAPGMTFDGNWEISTVGRVIYMRTGESGSTLRATFSGTTLYLQALLSPNAGSLALWVDPDLNDPGPALSTVDLTALQAQDAAIVLVEGLAAEPHSIVLVSAGGDVSVSGLFVKGQPASGWNAGVSAFALILLASAAMAVVGLSRVQDIRNRTMLPPGRTAQSTHPRAYQRDA
jgi:hypothetical protein